MVKVTVRVPATSANLGPGFDCTGCAFKLYNTISFSLTDNGLTFSGCENKYANENNIAYCAFRDVYNYLNKPVPSCHISFDSIDIPVSRGLGSSAALLVAGATAANAFEGNPLTKEEILSICNILEGHPDNLAPAIYGGLTVTVMNNGKPYSANYNINKNLKFVALVPNFEFLTKTARHILPKEIALTDGTFNTSHLGVLLKALENGDKALIKIALQDRFHQPYRRTVIKGYDQAEKAALDCGAIGFCLSGGGPACLCITDNDDFKNSIEDELKRIGLNWAVLSLELDFDGATII